MSNGKDVVKIPIRSLDEYKIRYNYDKINMLGKETVTAKLVMSLREMDQVVKTKGPGKGKEQEMQMGKITMKLKSLF